MNYKEVHLINNIFIIPPNENLDYRYCPREEIVHPLKLQSIVENSLLHWNNYDYEGTSFYISWLPWYRKYKIYDTHIYTSVFHVLAEKPGLFTLFQNIIEQFDINSDNDNIKSLTEWLMLWWNEPYLITVPIMHSNQGPFICNLNNPLQHISLHRNIPDEYLNILLNKVN